MSLSSVAEQRSGGSSIRTGFRVRPSESTRQNPTVVNPIEPDTGGHAVDSVAEPPRHRNIATRER